MTAISIGMWTNPENGRFESGFNSSNSPEKRYINLVGSGFGGAPTKILYHDWRYKTVGERAVKGSFDSGLYGATGAEYYPLYGSLGGVTGICSYDNLNIDYDITVRNNEQYKITISGKQYVITSDASATDTEIVTALKNEINGDSGCPAVASGTTYLSLTRKVSATPFSVFSLQTGSTSSLTIGTGSKSFTLSETGVTFYVGQSVTIANTAFVDDAMSGAITAFNSGTGAITVNVTSSTGSGTYASWKVSATDTVSESPSASSNIINRNNPLTGFTKIFTANKSFFVAWQAGTPDGYYFSGAVTERTFPQLSAQKMNWLSNGGLDSPKKADVVALSRSSATSWSFVGNQSNVNVYNGSAYSWNKPNSYFSYHKSGASPFTDNGIAISGIATDAGATTASQTGSPLFIKLSTLTVTVQNSTNYIVTVNGTPCTTYTSDASATESEINTGLASAINGSTSAVVASVQNGTVVCTAVTGTNPTVTATANILVENLDPSFDQISTIWQGNGNQANVNTIYPMLGLWVGDNCGNQVALTDSATFSSCTKFLMLDHDLFSDTAIDAYYYDLQAVGMTHWMRFKDGIAVASGAL
jgi:hypothetical protein